VRAEKRARREPGGDAQHCALVERLHAGALESVGGGRVPGAPCATGEFLAISKRRLSQTHNIHILLLARAPLMACCFLNKDADLTHFPTFVTPSAGETDACGKHCGPISYAFPTTQIVCCARDPYVRDADDAYDADGAKRMPVRCGVFMVLCLPLFALMEVGLTMYACVSPRSYKSCRGR
jgi:hypothetical protein